MTGHPARALHRRCVMLAIGDDNAMSGRKTCQAANFRVLNVPALGWLISVLLPVVPLPRSRAHAPRSFHATRRRPCCAQAERVAFSPRFIEG
jgi:hypothetical protein